ncbi:MAG: polymer-forming cytoskeletal protein [Phycisphaerales bacterium]
MHATTDETPAWAPPLPTRPVRCYLCATEFDVAPKAMSASCPHCYRRIVVEDVIIRGPWWGGKIETCGAVEIHKRTRATATMLLAGGGVLIHGYLDGHVVSGGLVRLTERATVRGRVRAPRIEIHPGAVIDNALLEIPATPLEALAPVAKRDLAPAA